MTVRAGRAEVELSILDRTKRGLAKVENNITAFAGRISLAGAGILTAGGGIGLAFASSVKEFAKTEQLIGRFKSVFKELEQDAGKFADRLAAGIGQSGLEIRDQLSQFQAIFKGSGFDNSQSFTLSSGLTEMTQDSLAFNDAIRTSGEALQRLLSGIAGETEAVRRFGADVRTAKVDLELMALGTQEAAKDVSEAERQLARFSIIARALDQTGATGQAARELNTLQSRFRAFGAEMRELRSAIGQAFAPIVPFVAISVDLVKNFKEFALLNPQLLQTAGALTLGVGALGVALVGIGGGLATISVAIGVFTPLITTIGAVVTATTSLALAWTTLPVVGALAAMGAAAYAFRDQIGNAFQQSLMVASVFGEVLTSVALDAANAFSGISAAVSIGDFEGAMEVISLTAEAAWLEMLDKMRTAFTDFVVSISDSFKGVFDIDVDGVFETIKNKFKSKFDLNGALDDFQGIGPELVKSVGQLNPLFSLFGKDLVDKGVKLANDPVSLEPTGAADRKREERDAKVAELKAAAAAAEAERIAEVERQVEEKKKKRDADIRRLAEELRTERQANAEPKKTTPLRAAAVLANRNAALQSFKPALSPVVKEAKETNVKLGKIIDVLKQQEIDPKQLALTVR